MAAFFERLRVMGVIERHGPQAGCWRVLDQRGERCELVLRARGFRSAVSRTQFALFGVVCCRGASPASAALG
eukprot:690448-Lingulodinium_polyedra.AAC.1